MAVVAGRTDVTAVRVQSARMVGFANVAVIVVMTDALTYQYLFPPSEVSYGCGSKRTKHDS